MQNFGQNICCWKILDGRNFVDVFGGIFGGNFSGNAIFDILEVLNLLLLQNIASAECLKQVILSLSLYLSSRHLVFVIKRCHVNVIF